MISTQSSDIRMFKSNRVRDERILRKAFLLGKLQSSGFLRDPCLVLEIILQ